MLLARQNKSKKKEQKKKQKKKKNKKLRGQNFSWPKINLRYTARFYLI